MFFSPLSLNLYSHFIIIIAPPHLGLFEVLQRAVELVVQQPQLTPLHERATTRRRTFSSRDLAHMRPGSSSTEAGAAAQLWALLYQGGFEASWVCKAMVVGEVQGHLKGGVGFGFLLFGAVGSHARQFDLCVGNESRCKESREKYM